MTPRSFLQNQLRDQERAKLAALPTNDALTLLFGQKQALDTSLTTLSGKTIGGKGLDLLAAPTADEAKAELTIKTTDVEGLEDGLSRKADQFDVLSGGTF